MRETAPRVTVLVPTHDHGPLLVPAVRSALSQTVKEIEVFIVGDGVPDRARPAIDALVAEDDRVRFFDNPKGPRHGELHRHVALAAARGRIVCYLCDDDLWLPEHLETMERLLQHADFASTGTIGVHPDGALDTWHVDLALPYFRDLLLAGENRVPLSAAGHTLAMYRRMIDGGWRTTPDGIHTDLYMWQQFLRDAGCRAVTGQRPTVIHFPSPQRPDWSEEQRLEELSTWAERLAEPGAMERILSEFVEMLMARSARFEIAVANATARAHALEAHASGLQEQLHAQTKAQTDLERRLAEQEARIRELRDELARKDGDLTFLRGEHRAVLDTRTWRIRERLLRLPLLGRVLRWSARGRGGRAGP